MTDLHRTPPSQESPDSPDSGTSRTALFAGLAAVLVGAVLAISAFTGGTESPGPVDLTASEFQLIDGSTGSLADYEGQPVVVNFFASWCAPCRAELPDFEAVSNERSDVLILGVNTDIAEASWRSFVEETEITYPTVFQPSNELFLGVEAKGMPTTVILSADGEVLDVHSGLLTKNALNDLIDTNIGS